MEDVDVYFDDLTITHTGISIIQSTDYYPYGLVLRESKDEDYRFGYQGQFAEKDDETGWNHFELRQYDPVIGRWLQVDSKRQFSSPYVNAANNPVAVVDPAGSWAFFINIIDARASVGDGIGGTGNIALSFAVDDNGNIALTYTGGVGIAGTTPGGYGSVGMSGTIFPQADQIYDVMGVGLSLGVHSKISAEANFAFGEDQNGNFEMYNGWSFGLKNYAAMGGGAVFADVNFTESIAIGRPEIIDYLSKFMGEDQIKDVLQMIDDQIEKAHEQFDPKPLEDFNLDKYLTVPLDALRFENDEIIKGNND